MRPVLIHNQQTLYWLKWWHCLKKLEGHCLLTFDKLCVSENMQKRTLNCIFFLTRLPRETRVKGIFSTTSTCQKIVFREYSPIKTNILRQKGIFCTKKEYSPQKKEYSAPKRNIFNKKEYSPQKRNILHQKGIFSTKRGRVCTQKMKGIFSTLFVWFYFIKTSSLGMWYLKSETITDVLDVLDVSDVLDVLDVQIWQITSNMSTFSTLPVTRRKRRS